MITGFFVFVISSIDPWFRSRLRYYVPVTGWLPAYSLSTFKNDVLAGLTVAFLLIPQSLSFAQALVKVPPIYGLYSSLLPLFVYSIFGMSRQLSVGPEALVAMLTGTTVSTYVQGDGLDRIHAANVMAMMVGIITFLLGFFRLGFVNSVLSRPLLRGFVTAIALVVVIELSPTLLGFTPTHVKRESPLEQLLALIENWKHIHFFTAIISIASLTSLYVLRWVKSILFVHGYPRVKYIPEILLLVIGSTVLSAVFRWDLLGVAVLQDVHPEFIAPSFPRMSLTTINQFLLSAVLISLIGFVESSAVAKTYSSKHNYPVSPNRELVALGLSNVFGSMLGSWPTFGSLGRSAVNDSAGAKTQGAGFITGLVILVTMIFFLPYFYFLPRAVCASIIVTAALSLIELHDIHFMLKLRAWQDLALLTLTFCTTLLISIESGTFISVGTSLLLVIRHSTKPKLALLGKVLILDAETGLVKEKYRNLKESAEAERIPGVILLRVEESLFFGNVEAVKEQIKRIEKHGDLGVHPGEEPIPPVNTLTDVFTDADLTELRVIILDLSQMASIDPSSIHVLHDMVKDYTQRDIIICIVKLRPVCAALFHSSGLYALIGEEFFFEKTKAAVDKMRALGIIQEPEEPLEIETDLPTVLNQQTRRKSSIRHLRLRQPSKLFHFNATEEEDQ